MGLARQQFFQPGFMLEGPLGLGLIAGDGFFEPLQLLLFVRGGAIEGAQRVLDALHGADRIVDVDVRAVGSAPRMKRSGTGAVGWPRLRISNPLKAARRRRV